MAAARARTADPTARPGFDAYAGMLLLSLLAMVVATVLLIMDYSQYESKPQLPPKGAVSSSTTPAPGGAPPGGGGAGGVAPGGTAKGP